MSSKRSLTEKNIEPEFESNLKKVKLTTDERSEEISNYKDVEHCDHQDVVRFFRDQLKLDKNRLGSLNSNKKSPLDGLVLLEFFYKFKNLFRTSTLEEALNSASNMLKPFFIDKAETNRAAQIVGRKLVSFFKLDQKEENASIEKVLGPMPNTPEKVEEYYEEAWKKWTEKQFFQEVTLEELDSARKQISGNNYSILPLEKKENFVKALPIKQENEKGQFAKHYLPFLPSLHITDTNDKKLEKLTCCNVVVMSPSGMGKTSLIIRTLCKKVGLLITGTGKNEFGNGETVDESVRFMQYYFRSEMEAYAYVRQATLLLMIAKLFHILNLIDIAQKNPSILETFEGNLLAFLAFNQFNGNNKNITPIFKELFRTFKDVDCLDLRHYTMSLIDEVKDKTKSSTFLICVDEANVLEEHSRFKFLSINGNKRGYLSVFSNEIMKVNGKGLNIYAGTSFSINISDIVQSNLGKTEGQLKSMRLVEFDYFDSQAFIDYLKRHISISDKIECNPENFPLRIRQAALCLEYYINSILEGKRKSIEACLEESFAKFLTSLETKAKTFIDTFPTIHHCQQLYRSKLFDYIIHHKYPEMCGSSFYVPIHDMATHFLNSGIACPVSATLEGRNEKQVEFRAVDVLGYKFALKFLGIDKPDSSEKLQLAKYIGIHTDCRKRFEFSLCMALTAVKGKLKDLIDISSNKINKKLQQNLEQTEFVCDKIFTSNGFAEFCKNQKWIDSTDTTSGEKLYFDFAINFKERIANIIFRPSDDVHDAIIALLVKEDLVFLRISFKSLTGRENRKEESYKSTLPELMYFDNYKSISLDSLETLVKEDHTKKLPITVTTISQLASTVKFTWDNCGHLFQQFLSKYINNSLSVIFHPTIDKAQSRESPKYHNAVFIHSTEEVAKLLGSDYTTNCLVPFLETMKKYD